MTLLTPHSQFYKYNLIIHKEDYIVGTRYTVSINHSGLVDSVVRAWRRWVLNPLLHVEGMMEKKAIQHADRQVSDGVSSRSDPSPSQVRLWLYW